MEYLSHVLVMIIPFVALAAVAILLAIRHRTIATTLAALGFSSVAISHIASALVGFYVFDGSNDFAAAAKRFGWTPPIEHWGILVGLWVGAFCLLAHTLFKAPVRS